MEKTYQAKEHDEINADLFGNDQRMDYTIESDYIKPNKGLEKEVKQ